VNADPEPFGQAGVRQFLRPILLRVAMLFGIVAALMWYRSHHAVDALVRVGPEAVLEVRSIFGRVVVTRLDRGGVPRGQPAAWEFHTDEFRGPIRDAWRPGWRKTLGVQWGREPYGPDSAQTAWRLRVRWPTLVAVYGAAFALLWVRTTVADRRRRSSTAAAAPSGASRPGSGELTAKN